MLFHIRDVVETSLSLWIWWKVYKFFHRAPICWYMMRWNKIRLVKVYLSYNQFTITFQTIFSKGIYFIKQQNSKPTYRIFIFIYIYRLNDWSVDQLLFVLQIISSEMWGTLESSYINNKIIMIMMPNYNRFIVYNTVSWCPL